MSTSDVSPVNQNVPPAGCELALPTVNYAGLNGTLKSFLVRAGLVHLHLFGTPLVITSGVDSIHVASSKHGKGEAVDLRVIDKGVVDRAAFLLVLGVLARDFGLTVFDESNLPGQPHIHIEIAG